MVDGWKDSGTFVYGREENGTVVDGWDDDDGAVVDGWDDDGSIVDGREDDDGAVVDLSLIHIWRCRRRG